MPEFLTDRETEPQRRDWLADETVASELVWGSKFPANREIYRDSFNFDPSSCKCAGTTPAYSITCGMNSLKNQNRDLNCAYSE